MTPLRWNSWHLMIRFRVWHSWKFPHKQISEYIHIKKIIRTNVQIYSYKKFHKNECPNKYLSWKLYEYSTSFHTLKHSQTNVRIYSYKEIGHKGMSEYICIEKLIQTNICDQYLWIFEYMRHTLILFLNSKLNLHDKHWNYGSIAGVLMIS